MERSHTCWSCLHCGEAESGSLGKPKRAKCTITKRFGKLSRGYDCKHFEYKQRTKELGADGLPTPGDGSRLGRPGFSCTPPG